MKKYIKPKSKILMKGSKIKETKKVYAACGDCGTFEVGVECYCYDVQSISG